MEDMVDREYAEVRLKSGYIAELVHDAVQEAREGVQRAVETTAKAVEAAERGLDETMSAFVAWAARHDVDVNGAREAEMKLRFHGVETKREIRRALREGFRVWTGGGMEPEHYRTAHIRFGDGSWSQAWRWLDAG